MTKLNLHLALCVSALLPIVATAQTPSPSMIHAPNEHDAQVAEIQQVMNRYHAAVAAHDGTALAGLFLSDASIWLNVLTDTAYDQMQHKDMTATKVRVGSYRDFAKFVSSTKQSIDPTHSNLVIHTDGTIAAVYFDFVFNIDGRAENRGSETWQLVKTINGWRIAALTYSSNPVAQK